MSRCSTLTAFAITLLSITCYGQTTNPFNLPPSIPVPAWVVLTDWGAPNVYRIDSLIGIYGNRNAGDNINHSSVAKSAAGAEPDEDPYLMAYIRWKTKMEPCIQNDGAVVYDAAVLRKKQLNSYSNRQTANPILRSGNAANWTLLGPVQTFGDQNSGLATEQSNIYCIAVAPSNPSVLYAGSEPGTLYRSADKGLHWTSVSDTVYSIQPSTIAIDPLDENLVYCYDGNTNTILKTTNGGSSWSVLSYQYGNGDRMVIAPGTGRLLITGDSAIYFSDDSGATWTASIGSGDMTDIALDPSNADTVYAAGATATGYIQLLTSTDGGTHFTDVTGPLTWLNTGGARLAVTKANSNIVYCANIGGTSAPRIIKSTDRGQSWNITATSVDSTTLGGAGDTTGLGMSNGQGYYDFDLVVSPQDANSLIVGTTSTFKSTDGGYNFSPVGGYAGGSFGIHVDLQQAVANGGDAYLVTDGGVNYSSDFFTDVTNWSVRNLNLRSSDFWGFGQGWDQDIVVGGRYHNGDMALYEAYGPGNSLRLGGGEDATGHVFHGQNAVAGFRDIGTLQLPSSLAGAIQYSGASFTQNTLWPYDDYYGLFSSKLMIDPRYSNVYYVGYDSSLWKSTNGGASYTALHYFGRKVWRFDIARSNNNVMYVCTGSGLFKTTDGGNNWALLTIPVPFQYYNTDVAINPLNENNVVLCMANGATNDKVYESNDGGSTWTNITGTAPSGKPVAFLQYQAGVNGGIYAITNGRPSYVYYRDSTMSDWIDFSAGLPASLSAREGALIFYRDSKIRLSGNCSIFESPLYSTGAPAAQPMADKQDISCSGDTVHFFDYSMYNYTGATRLWSFPGALWVSSDTALRPSVTYPSPGYYNVTLTVTNAQSQSSTRTIDSMIFFHNGLCGPDTVAGLCAQMPGTSQTICLGNVPINSNSFSISCWVQPQGNQSSFSQIISHDVYPGSGGYGFAMGFTFAGYTPNLELCYTDSSVNYGNYSGLVCDSTQWNFVVLTYSPTGVTMYLNGVPSVVNPNAMPVIDLSQTPFYLNFDAQEGQGSKFKGQIDEVKFYNYALSQEEVRQKMHLIQNPAGAENGLLKYFQFNQYDISTGLLHDAFGSYGVEVPAANILNSTAPVATGSVYSNASVSGQGLSSFPAADVNMYLPGGGSYPDGEVVAFHLLSGPDALPGSIAVPGYFIINNYGANAVFTQPDSIVFSNLKINSGHYSAGGFSLFQRPFGAFGNTWGAQLDSASGFNYSAAGSSLSFAGHNNINHLSSQLVIANNDSLLLGIANPASASNWHISALYPNPAEEWSKIDITAPVQSLYDAVFTFSDVNGAVLLKFSQKINEVDNTIMFHLPKWTAGIYFLNVEIPGQIDAVRKFSIE